MVQWTAKASEEKQRQLYKELGLYVVTEGQDSVRGKKSIFRKLMSKNWHMINLYDFCRFFYVTFYKNLAPFVVLFMSAAYLVFESIDTSRTDTA